MTPQRRSLKSALREAASQGLEACPACAATYPLSKFSRPLSVVDQFNIAFFGLLGLIDSHSKRVGRLRCDSCGHVFRRRTSKLTWIILWTLAMIAGITVPFWFGFPGSGEPLGGGLTELPRTHPGASAFALLWIVMMTPIGVRLMLRRRIRVARQSAAANAQQPGTRSAPGPAAR